MANKDYDLLEKLDGKGICAAVAKYDEDGKKLVGTKVTDAETRNGKLIITKSEGAPIEFSGEANVIEGVKLAGAASVLTPDAAKNVTIPNAVATGEAGATNGLMTAADKKTVSESVIYKANPTTGAEHLLAQRLYIVRSDQEIINIITGGGTEGQGTILFRIG